MPEASGQGGAKGTSFTLSHETSAITTTSETKTDKIHGVLVCKSLYVRNEGSATSERWGSQSTTTAQFTVPRTCSNCGTGGEGQPLTWGDGAESPRKPRR